MYLPPETFRRRSLFGPPPPGPQTKQDILPTLLFSWFCTAGALTTILIRTFGRLLRNNRLFAEDKVMLLSVIPLLARMGMVHVILLWGTNNVDLSYLDTDAASAGITYDEEVRRREIGSRLVLAARIMYALFIWIAKLTVSEFLKRLTHMYWKRGYQISLHFIRVFLLVSFVAVFLATIAECRPITHYWQVVPDPGAQCRQAYAQLFTIGIADIITDLLLIIFPLAIIIPSAMPWMKKIKLSLLFSMSAVLPAITILRMISVMHHEGSQQRRTVFASGEILAAAGVANAVILGSFLRDRGVKKVKYRATPGANNLTLSMSTRSDSVHQDNPMTFMTGLDATISHASAAGNGGFIPNSKAMGTLGRISPQSRRPTVVRAMEAAAGSDEDLFKDQCYRSETFDSVAGRARSISSRKGSNAYGMLDDDFDEDEIEELPIVPRPAPVVSRAELERHVSGASVLSRTIPSDVHVHRDSVSHSISSPSPLTSRGPSPGPSSRIRRPSMLSRRRSSSSSISSGRRRKMSSGKMPKLAKTVTFSDPGGLLDPAPSEASTAIEDIVSPTSATSEGRSHTGQHHMAEGFDQISEETRAGSSNDLQDVGGLLGG